MGMFKNICKTACQIVAGVYAASFANRVVGELFDRLVDSKNKKGNSK